MPKQEKSIRSPLQIIKQVFSRPIKSQGLLELAQGCSRVVILCDDNTRTTPVKLLLPEILSQLAKTGITKRQISILVSGGTHRIITAVNHEMKELYQYLKTRSNNLLKKKQALVVISKKIVTVIYNLIKKQTEYQAELVLGEFRKNQIRQAA